MRSKPIKPRYLVLFRTLGGVLVGLGSDWLDVAISMAKRINCDGAWWEVVDQRTRNVVASRESETK